MGVPVVLHTAYFPPIHYIQQFYGEGEVWIEQHDHYEKQSYRNRCHIMMKEGLFPLIVPVHKPHSGKCATHEMTICYQEDWQHHHWQSIQSAYGSSPFFEYYADEFAPFFQTQQWQTLMELNSAILEKVLSLFPLPTHYEYTTCYTEGLNPIRDLRGAIHPKGHKERGEYKVRPYRQTFSDEHPFVGNLSILDLIFNVGSSAYLYLSSGLSTG